MDSQAARLRVGTEVQRRRLDRHMDQADLAGAAGVDRKTLRALEKGTRWPREASRAKIENALNWPAGVLERLLDEALDSADPDEELPSAQATLRPGGSNIPTYVVGHPSRSAFWPKAHPIEYSTIIGLLDGARNLYTAMEDIAEGAPGDALTQAARLHKAAMQVVQAWAGGPDGWNDLASVVPLDLEQAIQRDPNAIFDVLQRIRERSAD
ncbi:MULTISPECIES: helix-turn-helix transcriptional regulator [Actinomycetes]|uniref:helix-turn-helix transcriptional regulator n=1 Tax=Micromonospora sp. NPDC005367 TaxID=3155590 RepID=UPI0033B71D66